MIVLRVKANLGNVEREDIVKALKDTLLRKNGLIAAPEFVVKRSNYDCNVCHLLVVGPETVIIQNCLCTQSDCVMCDQCFSFAPA